jgi:hypothetical protein
VPQGQNRVNICAPISSSTNEALHACGINTYLSFTGHSALLPGREGRAWGRFRCSHGRGATMECSYWILLKSGPAKFWRITVPGGGSEPWRCFCLGCFVAPVRWCLARLLASACAPQFNPTWDTCLNGTHVLTVYCFMHLPQHNGKFETIFLNTIENMSEISLSKD